MGNPGLCGERLSASRLPGVGSSGQLNPEGDSQIESQPGLVAPVALSAGALDWMFLLRRFFYVLILTWIDVDLSVLMLLPYKGIK